MISNVFLMFLGWQRKVSHDTQKGVEADWANITRTRSKLAHMRSRRQSREMQGIVAAPLDLKAHGEKLAGTAHGVTKVRGNHWSKKTDNGLEGDIAARLEIASTRPSASVAPLPSSEDSFLAFHQASDDELFFDPQPKERWRDLEGDKTAVVPVLRQGQKSYSFAGEALFA